MNKNFIKTISLISLIILNSCGLGSSIKSAVTGQTKPVGDEFLVEKKNPLVLPPNFNDLPEPKDGKNLADGENFNVKDNVKKLIKNKGLNENIEKGNSPGSLEESILKKIK
mgnify:CR=1 FL=1|tara:strand:- start:116 stop:448 length:333 start_codon:yes stop_codon:yes gene_type:complete